MESPAVAVTVDLVLLTIRDGRLRVLLVRRSGASFQGTWALPGGFVRTHEDLDTAAERELAEQTGIALEEQSTPRAPHGRGGHLEQLRTYGDPAPDSRIRVVSVAYLALLPQPPTPRPGGSDGESAWAPLDRSEAAPDRPLASDHRRILADGVERARAKLEYTTLAAAFCGAEFTVADLRRVYEIVWGTELDPRNFHRKAIGTKDFLVPLDRAASRGAGRPAQLYRAGRAERLTPPLMRPPH